MVIHNNEHYIYLINKEKRGEQVSLDPFQFLEDTAALQHPESAAQSGRSVWLSWNKAKNHYGTKPHEAEQCPLKN